MGDDVPTAQCEELMILGAAEGETPIKTGLRASVGTEGGRDGVKGWIQRHFNCKI